MKVSVIIPVYLTTPELVNMTKRCLMTLEPTEEELHETIIVDDGSPRQMVLDADRVIRIEENSGYAVAINIGMAEATGDIFVIANNDLAFPTEWLEDLLAPLDEGWDIATCWTSDQDVELRDTVSDEAKFGSLFALPRYVYKDLGGFDEQFRGYFSDLDYRRRALDAGFRIGRNNSLAVWHEGKATYSEVDPDDDEYMRSMRLYEAKWGEVE